MPRFERSHRHQVIQLWEKVANNDYGRPVIGERQQIRVRLIHRIAEMIDPEGNPIQVSSTAIVDRDIPIGSVVWEGKVEDIPGTSETPESNLLIVVSKKTTPSVKARGTRRVIGLQRYADRLPEIQ